MCGSATSQAPSFAELNLLEVYGHLDICDQKAPHTVTAGIIENPARMLESPVIVRAVPAEG